MLIYAFFREPQNRPLKIDLLRFFTYLYIITKRILECFRVRNQKIIDFSLPFEKIATDPTLPLITHRMLSPIRFTLLFFCLSCYGISAAFGQTRLRIACYNTESLCDTLHDPKLEDSAFTPKGSNHWDTERYTTKIANIARVIDDLQADLLVLEEVENENVLRDLMFTTRSDYNYIHRDTRDRRGMDIVLLYRSSLFFPFHIKQISGRGFSREALLVQGVLPNGDTLSVIGVHLPSKQNTQSFRLTALQTLRSVIDSILHRNPSEKLIVLGDFTICQPNPPPHRCPVHRKRSRRRSLPIHPIPAFKPQRIRFPDLPRPSPTVRLHRLQSVAVDRQLPVLQRILRHLRPRLSARPGKPLQRLPATLVPQRTIHRRVQRPPARVPRSKDTTR